MIEGIEVAVDRQAAVAMAREPLTVLCSAFVPSTINAIVVVDGAAEPAALVNAVVAVTEVKAALLAGADVRCDDGTVASGTSTDAVVARATRAALEPGIRRWSDEHS
jgi:adenosylcobinamide amidohydrolase